MSWVGEWEEKPIYRLLTVIKNICNVYIEQTLYPQTQTVSFLISFNTDQTKIKNVHAKPKIIVVLRQAGVVHIFFATSGSMIIQSYSIQFSLFQGLFTKTVICKMVVIQVWVFRSEAPPLSLLYYSMNNEREMT